MKPKETPTVPAPTPEPTKAPETKPSEAKAAPITTAPEKPTEADLPDEVDTATMAPKELRRAYKKAATRLRQYEAKLKELETVKPPEDPETPKLKERLTKYEQQLKDKEERLRFADFTASEEYDTNYRQPYIAAFNDGREVMASLRVKDAETGEVKQFKPEDFDRVMMIQDHNDFVEALEGMGLTGAKAMAVIEARGNCRNLTAKADKAREEFKKNGEQIETQRREKAEQEGKLVKDVVSKTWQKAYQEPREKMPHLFTPQEGQTERNELLQKGEDFVAEAFREMNPMKPGLTTEQRQKIVAAHAEVYNKAASWDVLAYDNKTLRGQIADLESKLKQYQNSEPGPGDANRQPDSRQPLGVEDRLRKFTR